MNADMISVIHAWFKKADNDLRAAEHIITIFDPPAIRSAFMPNSVQRNTLKVFLPIMEWIFPKHIPLRTL